MAFFMVSATPSFAQIYQYRDKDGRLHFTNELSEVPEDQQPEILMKEPNTAATPKGGEGKTTAEKDSPDTEKEAPQAKRPDKPDEIPLVKNLNEEKAALEKNPYTFDDAQKGPSKGKTDLENTRTGTRISGKGNTFEPRDRPL